MRTLTLLALSMAISLPVFAQTGEDDTTVDAPTTTQSDMIVPPQVSREAYSTVVGADERSNYLRLGLTTAGGYIRNLFPGTAGANVNEATYLLQPTLQFDRTGSRLRSTVTYEPSFVWYQVPNVVSATGHNLTGDARIRLSPHITLLTSESFAKFSTAFGQTSTNFETGVGGSTQFVSPQLLGIFEPQVSDKTGAVLAWQFGRNDMVAGSGWFTFLHFTSHNQSAGMSNTNAQAGTGSWIHRLSLRQYAGGLYERSFVQARPVTSSDLGSSDTQSDNAFGFYTTYLTPHLSLSFEGGGGHYNVTQHQPYPNYSGWAPGGTASLEWLGEHTTFAMSYGHLVAAGQGVVGAYVTDSAAASGSWRMARTWTAGFNGNYSMLNNAAPSILQAPTVRGHTLSGGISLDHKISTFLRLTCNYDRIHETYRSIQSISANPDSDRVLLSLSYSLSRPIGQ